MVVVAAGPLLDSLDLVLHHAASHPRQEVVGLILSDGSTIPLVNQARSATRFSVGQGQMAEALASINPDVEMVVALYHSHPTAPPSPSVTDISMMRDQLSAGVPIPWVIVTPRGDWGVWELDDTAYPIERMTSYAS